MSTTGIQASIRCNNAPQQQTRHAKCPKCGKIGLRRLLTSGRAHEYHHGYKNGPIGPQTIMCIVAIKDVREPL